MRILYSLLLVGVTMVGLDVRRGPGRYVILYGVLPFLTLRFMLAALALAPYAAPRVSRRTLAAGAGIGLVFALAYLLQTAGLLLPARRTRGSSPGSSSSSRLWRTASSSGRCSRGRSSSRWS